MSQQHIAMRSRYLAALVIAGAISLLGAGSAQAQWAAKPAPPLPHSILDQAYSGSVVLQLLFERDGHVKDVRVLRSSGVSGLDEIAAQGAMRWQLDPSAIRDSDLTVGRQHLIKFYQNSKVARRVEPVKAFWKEL